MERISSQNYVNLAIVTESKDFDAIKERLRSISLIRLLHASMGLCTESGEFADVLKKHIFYGAALDLTNLAEEIGDQYWYCALALSEIGVSMDLVLEKNIRKLAKRFPNRFEEFAALIRDLEAERKELES